jgi:CRISPR-associated protein Csd1
VFRELVDAAARFRNEGAIPFGYQPRAIRWIIDLTDPDNPVLEGPFRGKDIRRLVVPDRQRSGKAAETNLKPYLLVDNGRYALGIAEPGTEGLTTIQHQGFMDLLRKAHEATHDSDIAIVLEFLERPLPEHVRAAIAPSDWVAFRTDPTEFAFEREAVRRFWADHLKGEVLGDVESSCIVCGRRTRIVRTLPKQIRIIGQDCQITSFTPTAFRSFGKKQTTNAPLGYECVVPLTEALAHLLATPKHRALLAREETRGGRSNPLRTQLAVFWLKERERIAHDGEWVDFEELLPALMGEPEQDGSTPPPDLAQLEALLRIPWTARESSTRLDENGFFLAVLSANKGRLAIREWLSTSLSEARERLVVYLDGLRLAGPSGARRVFPMQSLLSMVRSENPSLVRSLLRTAYLGYPPSRGLLEAAVRRARLPATLERSDFRDGHALHVLAAAIKLVLTHGKEEAHIMETVDKTRDVPAYLTGRLLSILEEAQLRSAHWRLNATLVDRFYGSASTAPAATFGPLIRQAETAHLPKIRRERLGYDRVRQELEQVLASLDTAGGFPTTLSLTQQGEFALGFYHQRALFSAEREARRSHQQGSVTQ